MNQILIVALAVCFANVHASVLKRGAQQTDGRITEEDFFDSLFERVDTVLREHLDEAMKLYKDAEDEIEKFDIYVVEECKKFGKNPPVDKLIEDKKKAFSMIESSRNGAGRIIANLRRKAYKDVEKIWEESYSEEDKEKICLDFIEDIRKNLHDSLEDEWKIYWDILENGKKEIHDYLLKESFL